MGSGGSKGKKKGQKSRGGKTEAVENAESVLRPSADEEGSGKTAKSTNLTTKPGAEPELAAETAKQEPTEQTAAMADAGDEYVEAVVAKVSDFKENE